MEEAAFLLKQAGHSVSDVGYQLGFLQIYFEEQKADCIFEEAAISNK